MKNVLVIVDQLSDITADLPGVELVEAFSYLTNPEYSEKKSMTIFNLCRSYRYQSNGYYVSLLAEARGHTPIPSVNTIQDLKSQSMIRLLSQNIDDLVQDSLKRLTTDEFTLSIYFGMNLATRYDRLAKSLYNLFQSPLVRAEFKKGEQWELTNIRPIAMSEVPEGHIEFLMKAIRSHFHGRLGRARKKKYKYDLAILVNPEEKEPPSDEKALRKFEAAANEYGFLAERVTKDDFARIAEFDAMFIRETTQVNHHTYRFARRAAAKGVVVIDDPMSIVRCSNKVYLAESMQQQHIPTPRTLILHKNNLSLFEAEITYPCVIKQPDSSFSAGVWKAENQTEMRELAKKLFRKSDLLLVQSYFPSMFDWRIGVLNNKPLYACKYYMVKDHWQIVQRDGNGTKVGEGDSETISVQAAPKNVVDMAVKAARLMGDGLYGVDLKQDENNHVVLIEINDNPSIDHGVEDLVLGDLLYEKIIHVLLQRVEGRSL